MPDEAPEVEPTNSKPAVRKSGDWSMRLAVSGLAVAGLGVVLAFCVLVWAFPAGAVACLGFGAAGLALAVGSWLVGAFGRGPSRGLGCALAALAAGMSFVIILLPAASCPVRENAHRANRCKSNLRQIGLACHIYADDNNEVLPPGFRELYPNYLDNTRFFKCPSDDSVKSSDIVDGKTAEKNGSYAYVPGLCAAMPVMILAYDKSLKHHDKEGHESGRNVLWTDAHVEWWPAAREAEFQKLLAEQSAAVEAWRKSGKPVESLPEFLKAKP